MNSDSGLMSPPKFDLIVAKDGTGNFNTITGALSAAPVNSNHRFIIKINNGIYLENVLVEANKKNITIIGDGMDKTIIRASKSHKKDMIHTYLTATLAIHAEGFIAIGLSVENVADDSQALALFGNANHIAYYQCRFYGYQDTICANIQTQFFRECDIYGTIDFIYGNAQVVFQNCNILIKTPLNGQTTAVVTAQGRDSINGPQGTVLQNCTVKAATKDFPSTTRVFLGRPWKDYSRVVIMQSFLDGIIDPEGWLEWDGSPERDGTASYSEYDNRGAGANTSGRITWSGYKKSLSKMEANEYSVRNFIRGAEWIVQTGIPVILDL